MLSVENWAEIRRLHFAEGLGIKTISKRLGVARNTVRTAIRARPARISACAATVGGRPLRGRDQKAAQRLPHDAGDGDSRTHRVVPRHDHPQGARRGAASALPRARSLSTDRLSAWRACPVDIWEPPVDIPLGYGHLGRLSVIVGVSGYSRIIVGRMIPTTQGPDLVGAGNSIFVTPPAHTRESALWVPKTRSTAMTRPFAST